MKVTSVSIALVPAEYICLLGKPRGVRDEILMFQVTAALALLSEIMLIDIYHHHVWILRGFRRIA